MSQKVCIRCRQDCADRPRVKDQHGRYVCRACYEGGAAVAAPPPPVDDIIPMADEGLPAYLLEDVPDPATQARKPCPACARMMAPDQIVRLECGYNAKTGMQVGTGVGAAANRGGKLKCVKCGYSLKGLTQPTCPECGTAQQYRDIKEEMREESRRTVRHEYLKPVLHLVIGFAIAVLLIGLRRGGDENAFLSGLVWELGNLFVGVPIGVVVFFVCSLMWIGFDQPWHMITLRLAGIYMVTDAVAAAFSFIPITIVGWAATIMTYVGMLSSELDLDLADAVIVGLVTGVAKIVLGVTLLAILINHFG